MQELLEKIIPNVLDKPDVLWQSIQETLIMTLWSGIFVFIFGLIFGVVLTVTRPGGIRENPGVYQILDKCINFFRSIPFIILLAGLMPLSRLLTGTAIGVTGAIVPLVFGATPFFTRQIENAFAEVDKGLIEAARAMGCSTLEIIFLVYFKESIPGIARGTTITIISLLGLTAMAGAVGAGGLGDFAIRYGHDRNQADVTYVTVIVLVLFVSLIQFAGTVIEKKNQH
ncbi:MAG: ABC transporter permease [Clostridia bacterium]|nr:ABC transporter permease [Lachnospiraceae bacterium]NCB99572.1 ABC transporter permease [Clostridia bacterium]NCD01776.1 ABC transporter permease [Clostridia bacterium]